MIKDKALAYFIIGEMLLVAMGAGVLMISSDSPSNANTNGAAVTNAEPTLYLRYVYKDGRYVLQQQWRVKVHGGDPALEWRDVPTADQTEP